MPVSYWYPLEEKLILASRSPRRAVILGLAGIPFDQIPSAVEEVPMEGAPENIVAHWAGAKALDIAAAHSERPVLGADTMVAVKEHVLGKPSDRREARAMLRMLSGAWHSVYGGVNLIWKRRGLDITVVERTRVRFRQLDDREIDAYVATGEPMDKAGAYGIQGYGCVLVERVEGCYFNVMGLPISRLVTELRSALI